MSVYSPAIKWHTKILNRGKFWCSNGFGIVYYVSFRFFSTHFRFPKKTFNHNLHFWAKRNNNVFLVQEFGFLSSKVSWETWNSCSATQKHTPQIMTSPKLFPILYQLIELFISRTVSDVAKFDMICHF